MKLNAILFNSLTAQICKSEGSISAPTQRVSRETLGESQHQNWDIAVMALNGLLEVGESVITTEINPAPPFPITFEEVEEEFDGQTFMRQNPTAWRDTLNVHIKIRMADGGSRRVTLNTEQFSVTAAKDALLELWSYFDY